MKKLVFLLLVLVIASGAGLAATDFGVILTSDSVASINFGDSSSPIIFAEIPSLDFWLSVPFNESLWLEASIYGRINYKFYTSNTWAPSFGVSSLAFKGNFTNALGLGTSFGFEVGRLQSSDPTGLVFKQPADGFSLIATWPNAQVTLGSYMTGLLFVKDASIIISDPDRARPYSSSDAFGAAVTPNSSRSVTLLKARFVELFWRQDLDLFFMLQFDMNQGVTETVDTQYYGLKLSGQIVGGLYYQCAFVFDTGQVRNPGISEVNIFGLLVNASLSYTTGGTNPLLIQFGMLYGSGDSPFLGQNLSSFRTISRQTLAWLLPITANDTGMLQLDAAYKLTSNLALGGKVSALWRTSSEALPVSGFDPASSQWYLGTEAQVYMDWVVASDAMISFATGVFFPNAGGTFIPTAQPELGIRLAIKLAL